MQENDPSYMKNIQNYIKSQLQQFPQFQLIEKLLSYKNSKGDCFISGKFLFELILQSFNKIPKAKQHQQQASTLQIFIEHSTQNDFETIQNILRKSYIPGIKTRMKKIQNFQNLIMSEFIAKNTQKIIKLEFTTQETETQIQEISINFLETEYESIGISCLDFKYFGRKAMYCNFDQQNVILDRKILFLLNGACQLLVRQNKGCEDQTYLDQYVENIKQFLQHLESLGLQLELNQNQKNMVYNDRECSICLEDLPDSKQQKQQQSYLSFKNTVKQNDQVLQEKQKVIIPCGHMFHQKCLLQTQNCVCPLCKYNYEIQIYMPSSFEELDSKYFNQYRQAILNNNNSNNNENNQNDNGELTGDIIQQEQQLQMQQVIFHSYMQQQEAQLAYYSTIHQLQNCDVKEQEDKIPCEGQSYQNIGKEDIKINSTTIKPFKNYFK